ncbi:hypothetical protein Va1_116 [Vibrio phage Va1]|nr:hypothetical protein Va1_116 [Vibrio phage Va1]
MEETTQETDKALRSISRSIANMNKQIEIIRKQYPEAKFYMACTTMNVLDSEPHVNDSRNPEVDVLLSEIIRHSDCGDW